MEAPPDKARLKKALCEVYSAYEEILEMTDAFDQEWKYYGIKIGWQLKAARKGKTLFWLTPLDQSLRIGFAVRETERERLLASNVSSKSKEQLAAAKKYSEGYPLRLEITKKTDMKDVRAVLKVLKELRS